MSESEEMYLVTIAMLEETGQQTPIPVSVLAQELSIQPVSANQMIRKMEESELIAYTPYKGVSLTEKGKVIALRILRHRRLWEVFLVENLHMPLNVARELACQMEHIVPQAVMEQLTIYLGRPAVSPEGRPIPQPGSITLPDWEIPLGQLNLNECRKITRLETDHATRTFLEQEGIVQDAVITILAIGGDGSILADVNQHTVFLSPRVASMVYVNGQLAL